MFHEYSSFAYSISSFSSNRLCVTPGERYAGVRKAAEIESHERKKRVGFKNSFRGYSSLRYSFCLLNLVCRSRTDLCNSHLKRSRTFRDWNRVRVATDASDADGLKRPQQIFRRVRSISFRAILIRRRRSSNLARLKTHCNESQISSCFAWDNDARDITGLTN